MNLPPTTLVDALRRHKDQTGSGITFIEGSDKRRFLSYQSLYDQALTALGSLQRLNVGSGAQVMLQVEDNESFLTLFWACILGNLIPVPLSPGNQADHKLKPFTIWPKLTNPYLVADPAGTDRLEKFSAENGLDDAYRAMRGRRFTSDQVLGGGPRGTISETSPGATAYIQYSSGSTGKPKGVVLTHANLLCNIGDIVDCTGISGRDSMLSWMPLTHDMGLIGIHLTGLVAGVHQYLMPTALFIRRPLLWLELASEYRTTLLYSPNFGYEYFLEALKGKPQAAWELTAVRLVFNGAEPINHALCEGFTRALLPFGLGPHTLLPVYGLAEAAVAVTITEAGAPVTAYTVKRNQLGVGAVVH
ncbi:MAG: AMP-binding protein, partial [Cytophagales bacterium]|nr:AMP-binding protein [Cytophagales bacterium]